MLAVLLAAVVLAAVVSSGAVRGSDATAADGCHARVTCAGQPAATPLGASALPTTAVAVAIVVPLVAAVAIVPVRWRDRLTAGRLFRPPRLVL